MRTKRQSRDQNKKPEGEAEREAGAAGRNGIGTGAQTEP
jgi:hypothetical protein